MSCGSNGITAARIELNASASCGRYGVICCRTCTKTLAMTSTSCWNTGANCWIIGCNAPARICITGAMAWMTVVNPFARGSNAPARISPNSGNNGARACPIAPNSDPIGPITGARALNPSANPCTSTCTPGAACWMKSLIAGMIVVPMLCSAVDRIGIRAARPSVMAEKNDPKAPCPAVLLMKSFIMDNTCDMGPRDDCPAAAAAPQTPEMMPPMSPRVSPMPLRALTPFCTHWSNCPVWVAWVRNSPKRAPASPRYCPICGR